jgi:hypothetical protein
VEIFRKSSTEQLEDSPPTIYEDSRKELLNMKINSRVSTNIISALENIHCSKF